MERLDASLGLTQTPLSPLSPPVEFAVRHAVMEPLMSHDGVLAMLEHLSRTLCLKLTRAGEGAVYLELALYRADGSRAIVQAGLSRPSARAEHLERLLAPRLEKIDMGFGVDAASLKARETQALSAVQEALTGEGGTGTELAELADRIATREDGAPVSVTVPVASHQPERAEKKVKGFGEAGTAFLQGTRPSDREAGFARARAGVEQGSTAVRAGRQTGRPRGRPITHCSTGRKKSTSSPRYRTGRRCASPGAMWHARCSRHPARNASRRTGGGNRTGPVTTRARAIITPSRTRPAGATGSIAKACTKSRTSPPPAGSCTGCLNESISLTAVELCSTPARARAKPASRSLGLAPCRRVALAPASRRSEYSVSEAMSKYTELQVTTPFSFLRGASHAEELVAQAKHLGLSGLR
jgi:hypothetical protein